MIKHIVLITDCCDVAAEQIKARIIRMLGYYNLDVKIYNAFTPPFQINNGMFLAKLLADEVPEGDNTLYLAILNPLREKPKRIFGKLKNGSWFVGADTGIFSLLFNTFGIEELWEVKNQKHYPFGGLHIHTVVASKLLCGAKKEELGEKIPDQNIKTFSPKEGEVVHIDNFGLSKIWLREKDMGISENMPIEVEIFDSSSNLKKTINGIYSNRMMNYEDNSLMVYPGSSFLNSNYKDNDEKYRRSGLIEIGLVRKPKSSEALGIELEDIIKIKRSIEDE